MSDASDDAGTAREPRLTAGELRRALAESDASWSIDPKIDDEASPPQFPLGGEVPPDAPPPDAARPTDFTRFLREHPPADPDLARACIDAGLLDPDAAPAAERVSVDTRTGGSDATAPEPGDRAPDLPAATDLAPPQFGPRSDTVEPP
ncbi:MAG: hypothetical protein ACXVUE_19185 [Solirubrobacteraceae bacterium]